MRPITIMSSFSVFTEWLGTNSGQHIFQVDLSALYYHCPTIPSPIQCFGNLLKSRVHWIPMMPPPLLAFKCRFVPERVNCDLTPTCRIWKECLCKLESRMSFFAKTFLSLESQSLWPNSQQFLLLQTAPVQITAKYFNAIHTSYRWWNLRQLSTMLRVSQNMVTEGRVSHGQWQ